MTPSDNTHPVEDNTSARHPAAPAPEGAEQRARLVSRRALVRAGWIVPVVLAVNPPVNASAQVVCVSGTTHMDVGAVGVTGHVDACV